MGVIAKIFLIILAELAVLYLLMWLFISFVAGGNWLEQERRYVRWRHYAAVKLRIVKPIKAADIKKNTPAAWRTLSPTGRNLATPAPKRTT